jgi:CheY-like chemotaxis protein
MAYSILIIDDDADTRSLLGAFLTDHGFVVYAARNGRHALQILERIPTPHLMLLDYTMPIMNGTQFLTAKRRDPRLQAIPVIVMSAWTREWTGTRLDVLDVLSKPVDLPRLLELVTRVTESLPAETGVDRET